MRPATFIAQGAAAPDAVARDASAATMTAADAAAPAIDRLQRSREQLRAALDTRSPAHTSLAAATRVQSRWRTWSDAVNSVPGAAVAAEVLREWWAQHPLHDAAQLTATAATTLIRPLAQRHPLGLVAVGLVAGGAFTASRPWRWLARPLLLAGLTQQLMIKVLPHIPAAALVALMAAQQRRARGGSAGSGVQQ